MCPSRRADGTLVFKVVFAGCPTSGKTTALAWVYEKEGLASGQLQSISDPTGRTLFFDRLVAKVSNVVFAAYTVAGEFRHKFQRQTVLNGTDAIIFFWDSDPEHWNDNILYFKELLQMIGNKVRSLDGKTPPEIPLVMCANGRDLPKAVPIEKIRQVLKAAGLPNTVIFETIALTGTNIRRAFVYAGRETALRHYQKLRSGEEVTPSEQTEIEKKVMESILYRTEGFQKYEEKLQEISKLKTLKKEVEELLDDDKKSGLLEGIDKKFHRIIEDQIEQIKKLDPKNADNFELFIEDCFNGLEIVHEIYGASPTDYEQVITRLHDDAYDFEIQALLKDARNWMMKKNYSASLKMLESIQSRSNEYLLVVNKKRIENEINNTIDSVHQEQVKDEIEDISKLIREKRIEESQHRLEHLHEMLAGMKDGDRKVRFTEQAMQLVQGITKEKVKKTIRESAKTHLRMQISDIATMCKEKDSVVKAILEEMNASQEISLKIFEGTNSVLFHKQGKNQNVDTGAASTLTTGIIISTEPEKNVQPHIPIPFNAYTGADSFVFASYAHVDKERVYPLIKYLNERDVRIWYDEGIEPSKDWMEEIARKIMACKVFMVFLSPIAVTREDVLNEIALAEGRLKMHEIIFVPVYLDRFILPPKLQLAIGRLQAIIKPDLEEIRFQDKLLFACQLG